MREDSNLVRVKICGITNHEDAVLAVNLGVNALGFIFAESPRRISPENAKDIISALPPFVNSVGVFVDEDPGIVQEIMKFCALDYVQFHGKEPPDICLGHMPRTIKALRVKDDSSVQLADSYKGKVRAFLLDTYSEDKAGGTGEKFDWDLALSIKKIGVPVLLAGGLGPANILDAISFVKPYAVDINSGIEERPGKKDHVLMKAIMEKVHSANIRSR